jgi:ankyrin repeat protein
MHQVVDDEGEISLRFDGPFAEDELLEAVCKLDLAEVRQAIADGADLTLRVDNNGARILHIAVLAHEAKVERFAKEMALLREQKASILASGADPREVEFQYEIQANALATRIAISVNERTVPIIEALLAAGADRDAQDLRGATPLHYAVVAYNHEAAGLRVCNAPALRELLKVANPNVKDNDGDLPINYACPAAMRILLECEAVRVTLQNGNGEFCLPNDRESLRLLVASPRLEASEVQVALIKALNIGDLEAAAIFRDSGRITDFTAAIATAQDMLNQYQQMLASLEAAKRSAVADGMELLDEMPEVNRALRAAASGAVIEGNAALLGSTAQIPEQGVIGSVVDAVQAPLMMAVQGASTLPTVPHR